MKRTVQVPSWLFVVAILAIGAFVGTGATVFMADGVHAAPARVKSVDPLALKEATSLSTAFRQAAEVISPSVVSITSEKKVSIGSRLRGSQIPDEFRRFFGDDFGGFFENPGPRGGVQKGFGTGFIVREDGYILTNNHVVDGADKVTVRLEDETEYTAEVVGTDARTDLAVLRVNASRLPAAHLGTSDEVSVGDWVIAVGGPFGLDNTVTAGIISAKGRNAVGIADYENFLQTDAAINPGNSGGPLVNLRGEVVGINTAIASRSGANAGVGFAIPVDMARSIMDSLISEGRVSRGWLGTLIQQLDKDLAASFDFKGDGVLIGDVTKDSPAEKAGIKTGDIVTRFNGRTVKSPAELRNMVASIKPDTKVPVEIFRDGTTVKLDVTIGLLDDKVVLAADGSATKSTDLGLSVQTVTPDLAKNLGVEEDQKGVVVTEVDPTGMAASASLKSGDVIVSVNGDPVENAAGFRDLLKQHDVKKGLRLLVKSDGLSRFVFLKSS